MRFTCFLPFELSTSQKGVLVWKQRWNERLFEGLDTTETTIRHQGRNQHNATEFASFLPNSCRNSSMRRTRKHSNEGFLVLVYNMQIFNMILRRFQGYFKAEKISGIGILSQFCTTNRSHTSEINFFFDFIYHICRGLCSSMLYF